MAQINRTTALTSANIKTDIVKVYKGDFKLTISSTFVGTCTVLRKMSKLNVRMTNYGTHTGADAAAALTDTKIVGVTADELIGLWVRNENTLGMGLITDNTANVVTATLAGGSDTKWDAGEKWSMWEVIDEFSSPQKLIGTEPEGEGEYLVIMSAYTSGTARVLLSS
jgi:hypothetical protein